MRYRRKRETAEIQERLQKLSQQVSSVFTELINISLQYAPRRFNEKPLSSPSAHKIQDESVISKSDDEEFLEVVYQNTVITSKEQPEKVPPQQPKTEISDGDIVCVANDSLEERILPNFKGRTKINLVEYFGLNYLDFNFYTCFILDLLLDAGQCQKLHDIHT